ncbi:unnamed protein product [Rotaria sordida]|uniref:Helix-turn-helix domain-containing protein n=1 Tax=Rotaria sordida TaxID=392033 RepID=A0A818WIY0_9BILA|nr:unnamed protein product [Rotaria sordida]
MLDYLNIKQINGLKIETTIRLCRFVVQNNSFSYNDKYYHEIRGGAMGSPLALTIPNCYMLFFERDIIKQINNGGGLYISQVGYSTNFLDLYIENLKNGELFTEVYHKPSYEPYYLPFNSVHPMYMKKNIPFAMLIRTIKYCSLFEAYLNEREKLRITLLLNKYPEIFFLKFKYKLKCFTYDERNRISSYNQNDEKQKSF